MTSGMVGWSCRKRSQDYEQPTAAMQSNEQQAIRFVVIDLPLPWPHLHSQPHYHEWSSSKRRTTEDMARPAVGCALKSCTSKRSAPWLYRVLHLARWVVTK